MLAGFGTKWVKKVFLTVTPITCTLFWVLTRKRKGMEGPLLRKTW